MVCVSCWRNGALYSLVAAAAVISAAPAKAGEAPTGIPDPSIATSLPPDLADPGGVRAAFASRGVTFGVNYIGEVFGNSSGGVKRGTYYDGRLEVAVSADLEKMLGWRGLSFFANGYQIHGDSISADAMGVLMPVSYIEATPATRLFEMWLEQTFYEGKVSVRFGQIAADSEFILSEGGGAFINGTWGWPSITAANMPQGGPAYPLATPGVRVAFNPSEQLGFLVGLYNGRPAGDCPDGEDPQACNAHGLDFPIGDLPLLMAEAAYRYNRGAGQLPGTIKIGGWHQWGNFNHPRYNSDGGLLAIAGGDPHIIEGDYGVYGIVDQMIYRWRGAADNKGVSVFGRVIGSPADRNLVDLYWEAGLTFTGMTASRPDDVLGVGFAHTGVSEHVSGFQKDSGDIVISDYEALLEVSYTAQIVPGFTIQPDFQYFWNPGGSVPDPNDPTGATPVKDAAVFGVRSTINY